MGIILIVLIVVIATIVLISLFAPEKLPWYRPHLILERSYKRQEPVKTQEEIQQPVVMEGLGDPANDFDVSLDENVGRLEGIILEKNRMIEKLQKELTAEKSHRAEFEKVKAILDEEIKNLREQNKTLKNQKGERHA